MANAELEAHLFGFVQHMSISSLAVQYMHTVQREAPAA